MCDTWVRVTQGWGLKVAWLSWWRWVVVMLMDTAINMERVKILVVRAADQARKQFSINSWNTDNEIFLSKNSIKVVHGDYVQVYRESKRETYDRKER